MRLVQKYEFPGSGRVVDLALDSKRYRFMGYVQVLSAIDFKNALS
jgi:hypothetical protein